MCRNLCCSTECHKYEEGYALEKQKATTATVSCTQYGLNWSKMEWQTRRKQNAKVIIESRESSAYSYINIPHADKMHAWRRADEEEEVGAVHCSFLCVTQGVVFHAHCKVRETEQNTMHNKWMCRVDVSISQRKTLLVCYFPAQNIYKYKMHIQRAGLLVFVC